jgi:FtsZ-interacting cell division protein ZipA
MQGKTVFRTGQFDHQTPVSQITLLLEVPVVLANLQPFDRMLKEAADIAETLQGRLVDDNGINLTESSVNVIRQQLDVLYAQLEKSGIAAGSGTAIRLFS